MADGIEGIDMDTKNEDLVEKKTQDADTNKAEEGKTGAKKLDLSEIEGVAGGDQPIELPEI